MGNKKKKDKSLHPLLGKITPVHIIIPFAIGLLMAYILLNPRNYDDVNPENIDRTTIICSKYALEEKTVRRSGRYRTRQKFAITGNDIKYSISGNSLAAFNATLFQKKVSGGDTLIVSTTGYSHTVIQVEQNGQLFINAKARNEKAHSRMVWNVGFGILVDVIMFGTGIMLINDYRKQRKRV